MSDEKGFTAPNDPIHTFQLEYPEGVLLYGNPVTHLSFYRRMTAGDIEDMDDLGYEGAKATNWMLNRFTLWPLPTIKSLDAADWKHAEQLVVGFTRRGLRTGEGALPASPASSVSA